MKEFSLGRTAIMATLQFVHEVYHSDVSSNNSLTVIYRLFYINYGRGMLKSVVIDNLPGLGETASHTGDPHIQPAIPEVPIFTKESPYSQENHMTQVYRKSILEI